MHLAAATALIITAAAGLAFGGQRYRRAETHGDGALVFCGYVFLLFATVLVVVAGWRTLERRRIESKWRAVKATLDGCETVIRSATSSSTGSVVYWGQTGIESTRTLRGAQCTFHLTLGSQAVVRTVKSCCHPDFRVVNQWLREHPAGSTMTVFVDPRDDQRVSLGRQADAIASTTPQRAERQALLFGILGLTGVAIARARVFRRARNQAENTGPHT